jgi:hypothetical protein
VCNETHRYQSLSNCFHDVWAVFVGVSVPQQPTTSILRVFFYLYVCFCFAISTVFQAFFVSYLVDPIYGKKLETLDELLESDIVYGHIPVFNYIIDTFACSECAYFIEHKTLKDDCSVIRECVERMITKRDIATVLSPLFVGYVARELGTVDVGKIICSIDQPSITGSLTVVFKKGNPLLDRFNFLMRRYMEAGLMQSLWTQLEHQASLRGGGRLREAVGDLFFAFSVSQLFPAFVVLLVGTVLSSVVFIVELTVNCLCERRKTFSCFT